MNVGSIVTRISYNSDVPFVIESIADQMATMSGLTHRLLADAPLIDLSLYNTCNKAIQEPLACANIKGFLSNVWEHYHSLLLSSQTKDSVISFPPSFNCNVTILHIDGNKRYLKECLQAYNNLCLPAIGYSIEECKQPDYILPLLSMYHPNILVITGHDSLKRSVTSLNDLDCYVNSSYFAKTVKLARSYNSNFNDLVIIAGGCKSCYEALMDAGANYASSPSRVLINVTEPVLIAGKLATLPHTYLASEDDILSTLPSGFDGFGGIPTLGQCYCTASE